jgi:phosphomannomutase
MSTCSVKFGTDGWRGVIADDFTFDNVARATSAYAKYLKDKGLAGRSGVVVGYDTRFASPEFAAVAAGVLTSAGFKVTLSDRPVPSPCVSYAVNKGNYLGGVMITASHNPAQFNGFKIKGEYGGSAHPVMIADIEARLPSDDSPSPDRLSLEESRRAGLLNEADIRSGYLDAVKELVDLRGMKDLSVVVDPMFGSGIGCLRSILAGAGVNVNEIRGEINPSFPGIQPEPNNKNLDLLYRTVRKSGADLGLANDGDADRIGACDAAGNDIDSHRIFALMLKHLVEKKGYTGTVVKTFSTTAMIDRLCERYKLPLKVTPVGFKHITDIMLAENVLIGGEESGGIGIANFLPERDGTLCGLVLAELTADAGKPIAQIIEDMMSDIGSHHYDRNDLHLQPGVKEKTIERIKSGELKEVDGKPIIKTETLDGFKFWFDDNSWLMVRPSGTEPVLRVYCEAQTPQLVSDKLVWTCDWIKNGA